MKGFAYYLGKKVISNKFLYLFLNLTWGLLMTVLGFILLLVLLPFGTVKKYNGILYLQLKYNQNSHRIGYGFSIGLVFFVHAPCPNKGLMSHEYGHTVQNAIFGPFMPFLVYIPSAIRFWYREIKVRVKHMLYSELPKYDAIWFEGSATELGKYYDTVH